MTAWLFGQENHPAWCHRGSGYRGIGNGVHNATAIGGAWHCRSQQAGRACAVLRGLEIHRVSVDAAAHHV